MRHGNEIVSRHGGMKTVVTIPWDVDAREESRIESKRVRDVKEAYAAVPLIFRATRLRCNALVRVPWKIFKLDGDTETEYPFEQQLSFRDMLYMTEASLLTYGWNGFHIGLNDFMLTEALQWIPPATLRQEVRDGKPVYFQLLNGRRFPVGSYWTEEEMFFMREFSFDPLGAGTAPGKVALANAIQDAELTRHLGMFFAKGGLPITSIIVPEGTMDEEKVRIEGFFEKAARGLRKFLAIDKTIDFKVLEQNLTNFNIDSIDPRVVKNVAMSYDIPGAVLTSMDDNYASAQTHKKSFTTDTTIPRVNFYEPHLNKFLEKFRLRMKFYPQDLPEMQEDEAQRAGALADMKSAGVPLLTAMKLLGYNLTDDVITEINAAQGGDGPVAGDTLGKIPLAIQQLALARARAEESGDTDLYDKLGVAIEGLLKGVSTDGTAVKSDLERWKRKVLRRLRSGVKAQIDFTSPHIPDGVRAKLFQALEHVDTEHDVLTLFRSQKMIGGAA